MISRLNGFFERKTAFWGILSLLCILRLLNPDADSSTLKLTADLSDEGWWAASAIHHHFFNEWLISGQSGGIILAPFYNLLLSVWFSLFGIGCSQLRILHILVSLGSIACFYSLLQQTWTKQARLGTILFASNFFLFTFNRLGFVENIQLFLMLLHFALLPKAFAGKSNWGVVVAGFFIVAAILTKISFLLFSPLILTVWLLFTWHQGAGLKKAGIMLSMVLISIGIYYWLIFIPMQPAFLQQKLWMNQTFGGISKTFDLYRIWFWLAHFIQVPFLLHPSNCLLISLAICNLRNIGNLGEIAHWKRLPFGFILALCCFLTCILIILFSDGSERRLVFMLPFLCIIALQVSEKTSESKQLPIALTLIIWAFLLGNCYFFLIPYFPILNQIGAWILIAKYSFIALFLFASLIIVAAFGIKYKPSHAEILTSIFLSIWVICYSVSSSLWLGFHSGIGIAIGLILCITIVSRQSRLAFSILFIGLILNIGLQMHLQSNPKFSNRNVAKKATQLFGKSTVAGPNIIFGFGLYGKHQPLFHSDIARGYEAIYQPQLKAAKFYVDAYPLGNRNYNQLSITNELVKNNLIAKEVYRDTVWPQFGHRAEVLTIFELKQN